MENQQTFTLEPVPQPWTLEAATPKVRRAIEAWFEARQEMTDRTYRLAAEPHSESLEAAWRDYSDNLMCAESDAWQIFQAAYSSRRVVVEVGGRRVWMARNPGEWRGSLVAVDASGRSWCTYCDGSGTRITWSRDGSTATPCEICGGTGRESGLPCPLKGVAKDG